MDLRLYARVLSRHSTLLLIGFAAAVLLAGLSYYRVTTDGVVPKLTPRKAELWQSQANVFLTEGGFPLGRRTIPFVTKIIAGEPVAVPQYNDPNRYAAVASLYARLAQSDQVQQLILKDGRLPGSFQAAPTIDSTTARGEPLPMISLFGSATTAGNAQATVTRGLDAFVSYVRAQQRAAGIAEKDRIELRVVNAPQGAVLIVPRKKTLPVVVFLAVLVAAIAAAFILENARRTTRHVRLVEETEPVVETAPVPAPSAAPAPARDPVPAPAAAPTPSMAPAIEPEPEPVTVRRWA